MPHPRVYCSRTTRTKAVVVAVAVRAAEEVSVGVEKGKAVAGMETEAVGTAVGGGKEVAVQRLQTAFVSLPRQVD